jgi:hypothetical protein
MHPMERRPSRAWDRALNSFAPCANEPLDELTVAARTMRRVVCFGLPHSHRNTRHAGSRAARFMSAKAVC